jgi:hypothetical protein
MRKVLTGVEFGNKIKVAASSYPANDRQALAVIGRLASVSDLFSADAVCHKSCLARFLQNLPLTPKKRKR